MVFGRNVKNSMIDITNNILSSNFVKVTGKCKNYQDASQIITLDCQGTPWVDNGLAVAPENTTLCAKCYNDIVARQVDKNNLLKTRWENGAKVEIPESYDNELNRIMDEAKNCTVACKSCVYEDLSQVANFEYVTNCNNTVINVSDFSAGVLADLTNEISKSSGLASALVTAVGGGSSADMVSTLEERIESAINIDILNSILNTMTNRQSISVSGNSTFTKGLTQTASFSGVADLFSNTDIATAIISQQEFDVAQRIIDEKSVIGPFGEFLKDSSVTFAGFVATTSGQALRYGLWVITGLLFFMTIYAFWNSFFKKTTTFSQTTTVTA